MKKVYLIRENERIIKILNETYNEMMAALKHRNPKAEQLIDDDEMSQLHDILLLLRLGYLRVRWADDEKGRLMILEVIDSG